jgi:hypothetical protein
MSNMLTQRDRGVPADEARPFTKAAIAELTRRQISRMTVDDLVCVIRTVRMAYLHDDLLDRLKYLDRPALERLAYLARRTCRNQGY